MLLFYLLSFFKKGNTIQGGGALFKEIRYVYSRVGPILEILEILKGQSIFDSSKFPK